jgi:hypothetical protein
VVTLFPFYIGPLFDHFKIRSDFSENTIQNNNDLTPDWDDANAGSYYHIWPVRRLDKITQTAYPFADSGEVESNV